MKVILFCSLILLLSCQDSGSGAEGNGSKDLSTDEAVMEEVNKDRENKISKEDLCIERPVEFKELVLVGFFAHDRGCMGELMFYKGNKVDPNTGVSQILKDAGWQDKTKREVIALNWVKKVALIWESPLEYPDNDFNKQQVHTFMPPTVKTEGDEVIVAIWVREPSGMNPQSDFYLYTAVFSIEEADIIRTQITDRFSIEFDME